MSNVSATEAQQQEREALFQHLFDHMTDGVAIYRAVEDGRDFAIVGMNEPGLALTRSRLADVVGRKVTEVFPSIVPMGLLDVLARVWRTGCPETHPLSEYRDDRVVLWVENYVYRLPSGLVVALYSDTSEKRKVEEALRRSETFNRRLVEHLPHRVFVKDRNLVYVSCSTNYAEDLGTSPEQVIGKDDFAFHRTELAEAYRSDDREVMTTGRTKCVEEQYSLAGETRWARTIKVPYRDEHGAIAGVLGVYEDTTERKAAEEALRRSEETQRFLAQTSSAPGGEPFFNALARFLAQSLQMDFVCIDQLEADGLMARTLAVWGDGRFDDNITYALKDTPCGDAVGKAVCCFPAGVCQLFPHDAILRDLRAESYAGVTLWSHTGQPIGLIAVIGRGPLPNRAQAEATLQAVAVRAAGELERLTVEQTLVEAEWKFRALFEQGPIGVAYHELVYDDAGRPVDYRFVDANRTFLELTGVDPRGRLVTQAFPGIEDDPFDWIGTYANVVRTGEAIRLEQHFRANDRWYDVVAYRYAPDSFVAAFLEITDRKRAEEAVRESETQLTLVLEGSQLGFWDWDVETGKVRRNQRWAEMLGYTLHEIETTVQQWSDLQHPDDRAAAWQSLQDHLEGRTAAHCVEYRMQHKDGSYRWVLDQAKVVRRDAQGKPLRMTGTHTDITERKETDESLRRQTADVLARNAELSRINRVAIDREVRMVELKREINDLCAKLGQPPRHRIAEVPE